jgi:YD repeat-containing protein
LQRHRQTILLTAPFVAALLGIGPAFSQSPMTDVQNDLMSGPVRTVLAERAMLKRKKGQVTESQRVLAYEWTYRQDGHLIEERLPSSYRTFRYDHEGNRYEARSIHPASFPVNLEDFRHQQSKSPDGSDLFKWVAKYDSLGNRIEETVFSGVREPHSKIFYKYDQKGRRIESAVEVRGSRTRTSTFAYDAAGRITERLQYNVGAQVATERSSDFEFDSHGNWIKCTVSTLPKRHGNVSFEPYMVLYRSIRYI